MSDGIRAGTGPIVVAVSPSTGSPAALRWAAAEARYRQAPLRAVMAWRTPLVPGAPGIRPPVGGPASEEESKAEAEEKLAGLVRKVLGPDHRAECVLGRGSAMSVLLDAAKQAQLIVLGPPRLSNVKTLTAGLLAPQLVYRSPCPVAVIPPESPPEVLEEPPPDGTKIGLD